MFRLRVPIVVPGLAGLLVLVSLVLLYNSPSAQNAREREDVIAGAGAEGERPPTLLVEAMRVVRSSPEDVVELAVTLEPRRRVTLGAEVSGRVVELHVEENARVEASEALVTLDRELPRAAVERARAALVRAEAARELARSQFGRQQNLSGKGVASAAEFDRSQSEEQSAEAQVAEARAALAEADVLLDKTRIRAPFGGVVSRLDLEPGAYLRTGDPVAELVDLSVIEVEVGVDDRQILALREGAPVRLAVDAYPGEWFVGEIQSLGRADDADTRKFPVPVRVPNGEGRLLPGMLGRVQIRVPGEEDVMRLPRSAAYREFELDYLYVLRPEDDDTAVVERRRSALRVVPFQPGQIEVKEGVAEGEWVAVSGVRELRDGMRVRYEASSGSLAGRAP